jgi:hypothetical protein
MPLLAQQSLLSGGSGGVGGTAGVKRNRRGRDETRIRKHLHASLNEFIGSDVFNW